MLWTLKRNAVHDSQWHAFAGYTYDSDFPFTVPVN